MVRAAELLSVTQPAVSYLIGSLERGVGFALFERQRGKLKATAEAHQLAAEIDRLYEGLDGIEAAARQIANHQRALLRLLITPALSSHRLVGLIGQFLKEHPGMRLDMDMAHRASVIRKIADRQADLGIVSLPIDTDQAECTDLFVSPVVGVVGKDHPLANRKELRPRDLMGQPLILLKPNGIIRPMVDAWFLTEGIIPQSDIEARDAWAAIELVRSGVGIAIVSDLSLADRVESALVAVPLQPSLKIRVGAISHKDASAGRTVSSLLEFLREKLRDQGGS